MKQKEFAKLMGYSAQHITDLKQGRRRFQPEAAKRAEELTGINRDKWLYPDEFGKPWPELEVLQSPCIFNKNKTINRTKQLKGMEDIANGL